MRFPNSLLPSAPRGPGVSAVGTWGGFRHLQVGNEGFSLGLWLQDRVVVALGLLQENLGCHQQEQLWFRLIGDGFDCSGAYSWLESRGLCGGSAAIPSSSEVSSFPHVCSRANRIRDLMGGSPLRFRPLPISGHCMVVPFLVTKLCSPGKSVLRYLCQVTACTGPPVVLTGPPSPCTAETAALDGHRSSWKMCSQCPELTEK